MLASGPPQTPAPKSAKPAKAATSPSMDLFPCLPASMVNGRYQYMVMTTFDPWWWTVCHSGWWVNRNNRYVWVAGTKMHHHPPVHWIRFGKTVAFVPLHPKDVRGQPPVNREHGFTATKEKGGYVLNPIKVEGTQRVEMLKSPPREFRNDPLPLLARSEAPHMEMHALRETPAARAGLSPTGGVPLRFNHQTGAFTAPHQVAQGGGHSTTVFAPVGHSGAGFQGHSGGGSFGGGGGARAGGSSGGYSGGAGASHGGGGSTASSSSISVSSSASSNVSTVGSSIHK